MRRQLQRKWESRELLGEQDECFEGLFEFIFGKGKNTTTGFFAYDGPYVRNYNPVLVTKLTFPERCYAVNRFPLFL